MPCAGYQPDMDGKCYILAVTQGIRALPEMYTLHPRAYISGKALMPMLQLLLVVCGMHVLT